VRVAEAGRVATDALRANRMRSALTMFGVIVGVMAVVLLTSIGHGAQAAVTSEVEGLGSNLLFVFPGKLQVGNAPSASRLTLDDVRVVARVVGDPRAVAPTLQSGETFRVGTASVDGTLVGTTEAYGGVVDRPLARGSYLTAGDVDARRRVAVLGSAAETKLFGDRDPLARPLSIGGVRYRVVGVFKEAGSTIGLDRDDEVHIPITAAQRLLETQRVDAMVVHAPSRSGIDALGTRVTGALSAQHAGDSFSAVTQTQLLGTLGKVLGLLTVVLTAIAAISLVVAGVGVSNIMLVSVRERTREIGLRKAVGARQRDVLAQFLTEAVLLTVVGGLIGLALGVGGYLALAQAFPQLPSEIAWWSPVLALGVSVATGVASGVVPARRAGRLDPVTALRTD